MSGNTRENHNEIGRRIGTIRRQHGLSQVEFADQFCIPLELAEIVEHGIFNESGELVQELIPDLTELYREIADDFDVSLQWLMTGEGDGILPKEDAAEETVVYIPVTLSTESFKKMLRRMILELEAFPDRRYDAQINQRIRIQGFLDFFGLYAKQYAAAEQQEEIQRMIREILDAVDVRLASNAK